MAGAVQVLNMHVCMEYARGNATLVPFFAFVFAGNSELFLHRAIGVIRDSINNPVRFKATSQGFEHIFCRQLFDSEICRKIQHSFRF